MWNDLPYTVFDTGTLDGFKDAVNRWLLPCVVFSSVFGATGACRVAKATSKQLCFPTWACAAGFINNNNINNNKIVSKQFKLLLLYFNNYYYINESWI